ncbi:DegT/DnrJ/EryC1/StrS family aminotransferase [Streptomyces sp. TR02-1]|uniref:DegT/DnrJ/EryC1/StrS family aminotransferase n=1 Tax=Streptomyces sp. TR02-1 TaxID=3385977 RepID=UPI0039A2CED2
MVVKGTTAWTGTRIETGDEVVVPAFGGLEAAEQVRSSGAVAVPVDIDPRTFCIDPAAVARALTPRTVAVVALDLFGHPVDVEPLRALTRRHNLSLVRSDASGGTSEGGLDLDAAARRRNAAYLDSRLTGVVTPAVAPGARHTYDSYVVRVPGNGRPDRDAFQRALRSRGVACRIPVRTPVHRAAGFLSDVRLAEAERAAEECLALPVDPSMTRRRLQRVVSACNALGGLLLDPAC